MSAWFTLMGWNLKAPTLTPPGSTHDWLKRRDRVVDTIVYYKPTVLCTVETGDLLSRNKEVGWIQSELKAKGSPLRLVKVFRDGAWRLTNGHWRYIWADPARCETRSSGVWQIPSMLNSDPKHIFWAVIVLDGWPCLFISAHVENEGGEQIKVTQTREIYEKVARIKAANPDLIWDRVFWYEDTNSPSYVQNWLEATVLSDLKKGAGYKSGIEYRSQNLWEPRSAGAHRLVDADSKSIDVVVSGGGRNATSYIQPDRHTISDHDPQVVKVENLT